MFKTQECEVGGVIVCTVMIEMCNLPLLAREIALKGKADAATSSALSEHGDLGALWKMWPTHRGVLPLVEVYTKRPTSSPAPPKEPRGEHLLKRRRTVVRPLAMTETTAKVRRLIEDAAR